MRIDAVMPASGIPSREFMEAYWAALAAIDEKASEVPVAKVAREDSFAWLWDQHLKSAQWRDYEKLTQQAKRSVIGRWIEPIADKPFRLYRQQDLERSRDKRAATPAAANHLVKYLRVFFAWAIEARHMTHNPAMGVGMLKMKVSGAHSWTQAEVEIYRKRWPIGTRARLALELMLQVGARVSDAAQLGRQHEYRAEGDGTWLGFTAHKNRNKSPVRIDQPMRPALSEAIRLCKDRGDLTYLVTERGAAFTIKGLGHKMREWCDAAGLPQCSSHGLRKASATEFADQGATAHQLMAWFGWTRLATAETYTKAADRRRANRQLADLGEHQRNKSISPLKPKAAGETKRGKRHE